MVAGSPAGPASRSLVRNSAARGLRARQATSLSDADRAREFGTVGVLLMAAESIAAAEEFLKTVDFHFVARTKNTYFYAERVFKKEFVD